ncbi:MAG: mechanosensitive ion channel family protein [Pyrinomonadaceae bacterium]
MKSVQIFLLQANLQETTNKTFEAGEAVKNTLFELFNGFFARLPLIGVGLVVFVIFLGIAYLIRRLIKATALKAHLDPMLASLLARIGNIVIILLGLFVALTVIVPGIDPGDLFAGLGIGSVALGFAFKDVLQNLFAGFLILLYRPFKIGDQILINDYEGTVEEINVRATKMRTYDGERVVIPNSDLYMNAVLVRTAFPSRRTKIVVGIGYDEDHEQARLVLLNVLNDTKGVLNEPAPAVRVIELADSSVNLQMLYWTDSNQSSTTKAVDDVVSAAKKALDAAGIEIPFPQRVLTMNNNKFKIQQVGAE